MPAAQIVAAWKDATHAHATFRVEADSTGPDGEPTAVEYLASTPLLDEAGQPKANSVLKAELVVLARARRDRERLTTTVVNITGEVTL